MPSAARPDRRPVRHSYPAGRIRVPGTRWRRGSRPALPRKRSGQPRWTLVFEQLGMRVEVIPRGLRVRRERAIDDRLFERRLDALDPRPGWTSEAFHQLLTGERRADGGDGAGVEPPDPRLEVVDFLDVRVMTRPHVSAGQRQQVVQLVTRIANQPAHRLVLPALRV